MPVYLYDTKSLHPKDLLGILTFETVLNGTLESYKVGNKPVSGKSPGKDRKVNREKRGGCCAICNDRS